MKKEVNVEKLIEKFTDIAERGSLLASGGVRGRKFLN